MCPLCGISLLSSLIISGVGLYYQHQKNKAFENKIIELIKVHNDLLKNNIIPPSQLVHISNPISNGALHQDKEDPALYNFITHDDYYKENLKSK